MKKIIFISLALLLAACGVVQPVQQEQPTPIIATVLVSVIAPTQESLPTSIPQATAAPTDAPSPTPQPTDVPATGAPLATTEAPADSSGLHPVNVDKAIGKGIFEDIVISNDTISLNCTPREIQFTMKAAHPDVTRGEWYYRLLETDQFSVYSDWYSMGRMGNDGSGNFSATLKATDINPDWRGQAKVIVEFQFVGVNKGGGIVGRTDHIERMVTYYKECP